MYCRDSAANNETETADQNKNREKRIMKTKVKEICLCCLMILASVRLRGAIKDACICLRLRLVNLFCRIIPRSSPNYCFWGQHLQMAGIVLVKASFRPFRGNLWRYLHKRLPAKSEKDHQRRFFPIQRSETFRLRENWIRSINRIAEECRAP